MTNYTDLIARLQKMVDGRYATTEEIQTLAALEAAQAEIDRLTAELGDLPEAQADMLRTIKELQASLAWITEYIRAAPPELEEAKKWLLAMDNASAGVPPAEPSESAEHWHSLYIKKCQELHDEKARLGAEIETLELAAIDDAERYAVPPSQAQPPAPSEAAREYMTGYSDCKEWAGATNQAQPSQAAELDYEKKLDIVSNWFSDEGMQSRAMQMLGDIDAAIKQGGQHD